MFPLCYFKNFVGLPTDVMITILLLLPARMLFSLSLVSKNWRCSLRHVFIQNLQLVEWKRSYTSMMMLCDQCGSFPSTFHLFQISRSHDMRVNYRSVFDHEGFEDIYSFSLIGVHDGILCIQYRCEDMVPKLLLCNPLTKRLRSIVFPATVPDICMYFSVVQSMKFSVWYP